MLKGSSDLPVAIARLSLGLNHAQEKPETTTSESSPDDPDKYHNRQTCQIATFLVIRNHDKMFKQIAQMMHRTMIVWLGRPAWPDRRSASGNQSAAQ